MKVRLSVLVILLATVMGGACFASSRNGSDGVWVGTPTYGEGVFGGQAAVLDGTNGVKGGLTAGVTDLFNEPYGDNGWTMNIWVNLAVEDIDDWAIIAGVGNDNDLNGRFIHQGTGNTVQFSGFGPWGFTDKPYALNDWTMVTVVAKYSAFSVYVDGVHAPGNQLDAWMGAPDLNESNVMVGMPNKWSTTNFSGLVDEFTIWDGPMSADQIISLYMRPFYREYSNNPVPSSGSVIKANQKRLSWKPSYDASSHVVYFGTDYNDVEAATTTSPEYQATLAGDANSYDIDIALKCEEEYFWRVDTVNYDDQLVKGQVWWFTVEDSIMVEDFESYDLDGNDIDNVWIDKIGWFDMQIGLVGDPCLSPSNSMRLRYHVPYDPYYAIAARSFSPAQDWTVLDVEILTIHCYGDYTNFDLPMFVTVGDGTTDANVAIVDVDITIEAWQEINVDLTEIAAAGVDLNSVSYMEIGFGDGTDLGMPFSVFEVLYIDDIKLYPPSCIPSKSGLTMDATGDCVTNYDDLAQLNTYWLNLVSQVPEADMVDGYDDGKVDMRDFALLANEWLEENLWP